MSGGGVAASPGTAAPAFTFIIPGEPVPQGRPRAAFRHGRVVVYDPKESVAWKRHVEASLRTQVQEGGYAILSGPLSVTLLFIYQSGGTYAEREWHTKKPDIDNLTKAVLDAANGILWGDDAQVSELTARKINGAMHENAGVWMTVEAAS